MKRYSKSKLTILASTLFSEGGDWRSIFYFAKRLEAKGEAVPLVQVGGKRGFRQTCAAAVFAPKLLVNGLGTLERWPILLICFCRKDVRIYLHETAYRFNQLQAHSPLRYRIIAKILSRNPVLCVSKQAEAYYQKRFGSSRTHVVYECPGDVVPQKIDPLHQNIVMVGSINERKGVELFSRVADLAADKHPNWKFHWVGSKATMDQLYQSEKVTWHGWHWNPKDIIAQCDLFFLSSIDDPCPLAALEALHLQKRCVAFKDTGTAELIKDLKGCAVFSEYSEHEALSALDLSLSCETDETSNWQTELTSTGGFEDSVLNAIKS